MRGRCLCCDAWQARLSAAGRPALLEHTDLLVRRDRSREERHRAHLQQREMQHRRTVRHAAHTAPPRALYATLSMHPGWTAISRLRCSHPAITPHVWGMRVAGAGSVSAAAATCLPCPGGSYSTATGETRLCVCSRAQVYVVVSVLAQVSRKKNANACTHLSACVHKQHFN